MGTKGWRSIEGLEVCLHAFSISAFIGGKRFSPFRPVPFSRKRVEYQNLFGYDAEEYVPYSRREWKLEFSVRTESLHRLIQLFNGLGILGKDLTTCIKLFTICIWNNVFAVIHHKNHSDFCDRVKITLGRIVSGKLLIVLVSTVIRSPYSLSQESGNRANNFEITSYSSRNV